jgi:hypothetical protein
MRLEKEYRQLADSVRRRGSEEPNPRLRAGWENLAEMYEKLADQAKQTDNSDQSKKN